jgi:hypothetical protein
MTFARGRLALAGFAADGFFAAVFLAVFLAAFLAVVLIAFLATVLRTAFLAAFFLATFFAARFFTGADEGFFGMVADFHADTTTPRSRRGAYFKFTAALFYDVVIAGLDPAIHLLE